VTQGIQACYYDSECGAGNSCVSGTCWQTTTPDSQFAYRSSNPRIQKEMTWRDVQQFMQATGVGPSFDEFAKTSAHGDKMFLATHNGQSSVIVPLNVDYFNQDPQCSTCLKTVWNCNRYKDLADGGDAEAQQLYNQCKDFESCFLYDTVDPNGIIIPISVRMTPQCKVATAAALQKCATRCGSAQMFDTMARAM
jgi:hypothetical protein